MLIRLSLELKCEDGVETEDFYSIFADLMGLEFPKKLRKLGSKTEWKFVISWFEPLCYTYNSLWHKHISLWNLSNCKLHCIYPWNSFKLIIKGSIGLLHVWEFFSARNFPKTVVPAEIMKYRSRLLLYVSSSLLCLWNKFYANCWTIASCMAFIILYFQVQW